MFTLVIASWLALSVIAGWFASKKDLAGYEYFLLSLVLSPVVGFATISVKSRTAKHDKPVEYDRHPSDLNGTCGCIAAPAYICKRVTECDKTYTEYYILGPKVITDEIIQAVKLAGFQPTETYLRSRSIFYCGTCMLVINEDATWACYRRGSDIRRLCRAGYTFDSLLGYLSSYPVTA